MIIDKDMAKSKNKHYVVWEGRRPGIYSTREECNKQVLNFSGALYRGFKTEEEATKAWKSEPF